MTYPNGNLTVEQCQIPFDLSYGVASRETG